MCVCDIYNHNNWEQKAMNLSESKEVPWKWLEGGKGMGEMMQL